MESVSDKRQIRVDVQLWHPCDMTEIVKIENASFDYPWTEEELNRSRRHRDVGTMVARYRNIVLGFMFYKLNRTSIEILNFAVHPDFRRRGVGTQMVAKLLAKINRPLGRREFLSLTIRESNLDGQLFFRECGFQAVGVFRNYYEETDDSAYRMVVMSRGQAE